MSRALIEPTYESHYHHFQTHLSKWRPIQHDGATGEDIDTVGWTASRNAD